MNFQLVAVCSCVFANTAVVSIWYKTSSNRWHFCSERGEKRLIYFHILVSFPKTCGHPQYVGRRNRESNTDPVVHGWLLHQWGTAAIIFIYLFFLEAAQFKHSLIQSHWAAPLRVKDFAQGHHSGAAFLLVPPRFNVSLTLRPPLPSPYLD